MRVSTGHWHSLRKGTACQDILSFDKVFVGHYHNRTVIPGTGIEYIGSSRQHNFGEDEEKGYTVLYTDGTYEFVKNRVNMRYRVMDMPAERAGLHLMDELREMEADGRYKVKVRVHAPAAAMKSVDKAALLEAGAAKVELVADDEQLPEAVSSSLFEKFDSRRIRETYEDFCREKQIEDVSMGLEYLSRIETDHVEIKDDRSRKSLRLPFAVLHAAARRDDIDFRR